MMSSTFDGWAFGTFTKLKRTIFHKPVEGEATKVLTDPMLREVFEELDVKHVGVIRARQLERALRQCGLDVSRKAVRIILQELGMDPADGLNANDFVRFYREAEVLTKLSNSEGGSTHCRTYCLMFMVFSSAVVCCVFFWTYQSATGEEERSTWLLALIGAGCSFCFFLAYLMIVQVCAIRDTRRVMTTNRISVKSSRAPALMDENWHSHTPSIDDKPPWTNQDRANVFAEEGDTSGIGFGVRHEQLDQQQADDWGESRPMVNAMLPLPAVTCQASCHENEGPRDRYDRRNYVQAATASPHRNGDQSVPYFNPLCSADRSQPARVRRVQAGLYTLQPAPTAGPFGNRMVAQGTYRQ